MDGGKRANDVVRSALLAHFTDLRHQLEEDEGKTPRYAARLADMIGKSAEDLYDWCHDNEAKLMNYVSELRLARS